jgi:regulator of protease activity HflC (stomatin/prohibitin superfamily)
MEDATGLSIGIGCSTMADRKGTDEVDLHSYYQERIAPLARRILDDVAASLSSEESVRQRREFENRVEQRLQNGAKFIPRKRQPG